MVKNKIKRKMAKLLGLKESTTKTKLYRLINKLKSLKAEYAGFEYKLQNTLKIPAFYMKNMQKLPRKSMKKDLAII